MSSRGYDAIIIGGGIIGLSLALELQPHLPAILVLDQGPIGREASFAAAGMLNVSECKGPPQLQALAKESANLYPSFIGRIEAETGLHVDFQRTGALVVDGRPEGSLSVAELLGLEPGLRPGRNPVHFVPEDFVEPRSLLAGLEQAVLRRGVALESDNAVTDVRITADRTEGVETEHGIRSAPIVVNCAGAWAGKIRPVAFPTRPVKGQMIAVRPRVPLQHVIRCEQPDIYMLPRESGVVAIGATVEEAGFDRTMDRGCDALLASASALVPTLNEAEVAARWAGLRPGSPDDLPILGTTAVRGYYVATGHYRSGILLAPVTARIMAEAILSGKTSMDISPFSPARFG